jgi:hypothetical protein
MRRVHAQQQITKQQAMSQFRLLLASAPDEKILALTIDKVCAMHRVDRREAECALLVAQGNARRRMNGEAA